MSKPLDKYIINSIGEEIYAKKNNELKNIKELLLKQKDRSDNKLEMYSIYECIKTFNIDKINSLDFEAKRNLLNIFIKQIVINKTKYQGCRNANDKVRIERKN